MCELHIHLPTFTATSFPRHLPRDTSPKAPLSSTSSMTISEYATFRAVPRGRVLGGERGKTHSLSSDRHHYLLSPLLLHLSQLGQEVAQRHVERHCVHADPLPAYRALERRSGSHSSAAHRVSCSVSQLLHTHLGQCTNPNPSPVSRAPTEW